jgi:hypothetical protein
MFSELSFILCFSVILSGINMFIKNKNGNNNGAHKNSNDNTTLFFLRAKQTTKKPQTL